MKSWLTTEGAPIPLGVTWIEEEDAYNFAIYSKHADAATLLIYRTSETAEPCVALELNHLKHKSGRIWHCRLSKKALLGGRFYAWSMAGPSQEQSNGRHMFDAQKILLDPYAPAVHFPDAFDRSAAMKPGANAGKAPLGVLASNGSEFDWDGEHRPSHESELIIYEMHVRGFTRHPSSGIPIARRGTFSGVIDKIPYLKELGITAVELMPVFQFDPQEGNYWGYMTLNFFAPHDAYCAEPDAVAHPDEFRAMVKALHNADIEVILDVVFNHTAEGNHAGPNYSFKGIDNCTYYMVTDDELDPFANYSGTGNTLNSANRYVRRMILDSLRYWVNHMHVDGFRFDLASTFTRNADGSLNLSDPPIFGEIRGDPDLGHVRLIAEPWDAAGAYQLGESFPGTRWLQWNGRFRDDIRRFVRGDGGLVASLMYRIYGSDDLFPDSRFHAYHPYQSLNYVTSHDGFTLYDLVSYTKRRNLANGHDNTDGTRDNYSDNCGYEGTEGVPQEVMTKRRRQAKNLCCLLLISNGTPMILSGDEFLQTQGGNNNPYNQDNETTWLNWDRRETHADVFRFFRMMIAFRKNHPTLCRSRFWRDDIRWFGSTGAVDMSAESRQLAYFLNGQSENDDDLYVMINAGPTDESFRIQTDGPGKWQRVIDTSQSSPYDICEPDHMEPVTSRTRVVSSQSIVVFLRKNRRARC